MPAKDRRASRPPKEAVTPKPIASEITIQRLLEDFEQAEATREPNVFVQLEREITWKGRQFDVVVTRKSPGYDNFTIHVTKRRIR